MPAVIYDDNETLDRKRKERVDFAAATAHVDDVEEATPKKGSAKFSFSLIFS